MSKIPDLSKFEVCDVIQYAVKSEIESRQLYEALKKKNEKCFLARQILFLSRRREKAQKSSWKIVQVFISGENNGNAEKKYCSASNR